LFFIIIFHPLVGEYAALSWPLSTRRSSLVERLVATHRHAMSVPPVREIIEERLMLRAAIVPEGIEPGFQPKRQENLGVSQCR
jgi:hypothetical protein